MLNITHITTKEIWLPILGFEKTYEVSNLGRVRNNSKHVMKSYYNNNNYECIQLRVKGVRTHKLVHRLVTEVFCSKSSIHTEVNHKDGNKHNNVITNLEWCTSSHNKLHAFKTGLRTGKSCISTLGTKHKSKVSKYHNVGYDKSRKKWNAAVRFKGKTYFQKRFDTEEAAALHVNWILDELKLYDRPRNIV